MERTIFTYEVSKTDIALNRVDRIVKILNHMRKDAKAHRNSLRIVCTAYNNIPDELYTIPEFRQWIQKLARTRPSFLYFLCTDLEIPVHVLGCLGNVESVVVGKQFTMDEMEQNQLSPLDVPLVRAVIRLDEEFYHLIRNGVQQLCKEVGDPESEAELLSLLDYFRAK